MIIFGDLETNGINPYMSEAITGYFEVHENGKKVDEYHLKSQVREWSEDASLIHGISEKEMLTYPDKKDAWDGFIKWLPKDFDFACYVNPNTALGNLWFDVVIIKMELMNHLNVNKDNQQPFHPKNKINVYDIAKQFGKERLYTPIRSTETNRESFSQANVYKALYNESYDAHDAVADVKAMVRIYYTLKDISLDNVIHKDQLSLL